MATTNAQRLPLKVKLGFGVGDVGGNLFYTLIQFYLLFYFTDVMRLGPALAGTAFLVGKIVDAFNDPLIGFWSDRTRSRWGRRRPWIFWGGVATLVSIVVMFAPPPFRSQGLLFLWAVVLYSVLCTAFTAMNTPYTALLPELTPDYHQRTVLTGFRMSFAVLGTFIGAGAVLPLVGLLGGPPAGWPRMAGVMGLVILASALVTFLTVREPAGSPAIPATGLLRDYADVLRSREFRLIVLPWTLHTVGITILMGAMVYWFKYIYGNESLFSQAMPFLLVSVLAFNFVWVAVSRRLGKKLTYNLGMAWFSLAVLVFFLFAHRHGPAFAFAVMAVAGIGFSTQYVMPHAIVPDTVECDFARTGVRREGAYYAVYNFAANLGQSLGAALTGWLLALFGYAAGTPAGATTKLGIRLLCGPVPVLFFLAGIVVLGFYPVTAAYYREVRQRIAAREGGGKNG